MPWSDPEPAVVRTRPLMYILLEFTTRHFLGCKSIEARVSKVKLIASLLAVAAELSGRFLSKYENPLLERIQR